MPQAVRAVLNRWESKARRIRIKFGANPRACKSWTACAISLPRMDARARGPKTDSCQARIVEDSLVPLFSCY